MVARRPLWLRRCVEAEKHLESLVDGGLDVLLMRRPNAEIRSSGTLSERTNFGGAT
jgi:hypothetical protein